MPPTLLIHGCGDLAALWVPCFSWLVLVGHAAQGTGLGRKGCSVRRRRFVGCTVATVLWAVSAAGPAVAQVGEDSVVGSGTTSGGFDVRFDIDAHSGPSGEHPTGTAGLQRASFPFTSLRGRVTCLTVTGPRAVIGVENSLGDEPAAGALFEVFDESSDTLGVEFLGGVPAVCPAALDLFPNPVELGDIVVTDARRMVGKGAIKGIPGGTASYAYIVDCYAPANTGAPFEVRFGTQRFRLTSTSSVSCTNDPAVTTPAAGFETQTGSGTGTLTTGGPGTIQWKFVDGGAGGANDRAQITIRNAANAIVFQGSAAPPGKFPGSTQPTGYNTAQRLP